MSTLSKTNNFAITSEDIRQIGAEALKRAGGNLVKICTCCALHHTRSAWEALAVVSSKAFPDGRTRETYDDEPGVVHVLEYRNCSCGTTLVLEVVELAPTPAR